MTIKLNKYLAISLTALLAGTLLAAVVIIPQQTNAAPASTPVILPDGADGQGEDAELLIYACPTRLQIYAPVPLATLGDPEVMSSRQPLQAEGFTWDFSLGRQSEGFTLGSPAVLSYDYSNRVKDLDNQSFNIGEVIRLELTGKIDGYDSTSFSVDRTVVDPTFEDGLGTMADPYLVLNAADLSKMRCHTNKHFKLSNDIILTGKWLPIQDWQGSLDGNGKTISGLDAGSLKMVSAGLFGEIRDSHLSNFTLVEPRVAGDGYVGSLIGEGESVSVRNVTITGAEVRGTEDVGLLMGSMGEGGLISETSVQGQIFASPGFYPSEQNPGVFEVGGAYVSEIGGMVGSDKGDGTAHLRNQVDAQISITTEVDVSVLTATVTRLTRWGSEPSVSEVGGYSGSTDEFSTNRYLDVRATIKIETFWPNSSSSGVRDIGGFAGFTETALSEVNVESDIHIVQLGTNASNRQGTGKIDSVAGLIGEADGLTASFSNVQSSILIERADGTNNSLNITSPEPFVVDKVGGMIADHDDYSSDMYNRIKTDIKILGASTVSNVGGFAGRFDQSNGMGYTDNFVSGSIDISASVAISNVGGYTNLRSSGKLTGERNFAAMQITLGGAATRDASSVGPFVGDLNSSNLAAVSRHTIRDSFWDSTLNSDSTPAVDGVSGATTAQLKSSAFLREQSMDLDNVWILNGGYPELRPAVYTFGFARSGSTVTTGPSFSAAVPAAILVPTAVKMVTKAAVADVVVVRGVNLNSITEVRVGNRKVAYTVRPNGNVTFKVPNLAKGKYKVTISGQGQASSITKNLRVTSR
jgi:hypothetical protein